MANNVFRADGMLILKSEALEQLANERAHPLVLAAMRMVQRDLRELERRMGHTDEATRAYLRLRYERGLLVREIAARLGVSRYLLWTSVGMAARERIYGALQRLDSAFAERWYRQHGGGTRARRQASTRSRGHLQLVASPAPAASPASPSVA